MSNSNGIEAYSVRIFSQGGISESKGWFRLLGACFWFQWSCFLPDATECEGHLGRHLQTLDITQSVFFRSINNDSQSQCIHQGYLAGRSALGLDKRDAGVL